MSRPQGSDVIDPTIVQKRPRTAVDRDERNYEKVCRAPDCGMPFLAYSPAAVFCNENCKERVGQVRRYHSRPEVRAAKIARSAARYREHRDEVNARRRAKYKEERMNSRPSTTEQRPI
jgi:hypothetical protein